ncbi:MAG: YqgE/AlgH family protein, partial [bacterium]
PILFGGPVETGRGFVLHSPDWTTGEGQMEVTDRLRMTGTRDILEDIAMGRGPNQALMALGYAGWGPGQLEWEMSNGAWLVAPANGEMVFRSTNDSMWDASVRSLGIDPASLVSRKPIVLTEVRVGDPKVNVVVGKGGRTNLQALEQKLGQGGGSGGGAAKSSGTPIRIRIDRLAIGQASLSADLSAVDGKNYETKIAAVQRRDLGGAGGASPGQIAEIIAQAIVEETATAVARSEAKHQLDKLIDKNLKGDTAEAARGVLGGLFGK